MSAGLLWGTSLIDYIRNIRVIRAPAGSGEELRKLEKKKIYNVHVRIWYVTASKRYQPRLTSCQL